MYLAPFVELYKTPQFSARQHKVDLRSAWVLGVWGAPRRGRSGSSRILKGSKTTSAD
jgi:hypothetical protein